MEGEGGRELLPAFVLFVTQIRLQSSNVRIAFLFIHKPDQFTIISKITMGSRCTPYSLY